jgi:alpha 1,3-glucosidase
VIVQSNWCRIFQNILGKLLSYFQSDEDVPQTDTHWVSESGIIDIFVLLGPRPYDVFKQYAALTGTPPQPPLFSIAYHQSRWNYNDEKDVQNVDGGFDEHDIPYDVLWLDIEHTDGKRYFTWDSGKFPMPADMQKSLAKKGRKMVTIIDPHIKRDGNYFIHKDAEEHGYYVKKADNTSVYEGWCWPGSSSWIDFLDPKIRQWWSEQFALDKYQGSTLSLFTWNDMNEPSVFNGPEITMHKDARHYQGWEHRDVHNIYGMLQQEATAAGHLLRSGNRERAFVLSRAFFAGSQRFGAVWTGDNAADWGHLRMSIPMLLSMGVAGLQFVGADIGGFFKNPDPELLVRWYQAGAFYPFMRAHAHLDTRRREPWLYDADKMAAIRSVVRLRYQLLPYWYSVFHEAHRMGLPVLRPLWVEFPRDKNTWAAEDQFMVGDCLLVHPVTEQGATSVQLYLPGTSTLWYDMDDYTVYTGGSRYSISAPLTKIPVFQRGGTIVPKKMRVRRCSSLTASDPYTLIVALDEKKEAKGELYIDDGHSNDYLTGGFVVREFEFDRHTFTSSTWTFSGTFPTKAWVERIVILGYPLEPYRVMISLGAGSEELMFDYKSSNKALTVRRPGINILEDFSITIYDG